MSSAKKKIKNKIMPFAATWMDLEMIILSEVSQTENDKYHMVLKQEGRGQGTIFERMTQPKDMT